MGLSPRVRGNLAQLGQLPKGLGSIPARAGEPTCCATSRRRKRVYPRACGGTLAALIALPHGWGLSPRVRGNHRVVDEQGVHAGSIPARAGGNPAATRRSALAIGTSDTVYPRACGGTLIRLLTGTVGSGLSPRVRGNRFRLPTGLSPRVRGNRFICQRPAAPTRSIPARAGEPARQPRH